MKNFPSVFLLVLLTTMFPVVCSDSIFQQCIQDHAQAFLALDNHIEQNGSLTEQYIACYADDTMHISYIDARPHALVSAYNQAYATLNNRMWINTLGDGFILGIIAALCNKIIFTQKDTRCHPITIYSTIAIAIAWILYQNHKVGIVPYFDPITVKKQENFFEQISATSLFRILATIAAATVGFLGTHHTIERITQ